MDVRVTVTNEVSQQVEVELPEAQVEKAVEKKLKELSKKVRESGFRKGKVPVSIVRRKYGQSARVEAIEALVDSSVRDALKDEALQGMIHMGRPEVQSGVEGGAVVYSFVAERMPKVEVSDYAGLSVEQETFEVSDDDILAELKKLQDEHTQLVEVEDRTTVLAGDSVLLDYKGQGEGPVSEIQQDGQEVDLNSEDMLPGFAEGIVGAEVDKEKVVTLSLPADFGLEELAGADIELAITVRTIRRTDVPELDDALAKQSGDADTLDELKAQIRARLEGTRKEESESGARRRLVEQIVAATSFDVPPLYVDDQARRDVSQRLQSIVNQGMKLEQLGIDPMALVEDTKPRIEMSIREALVLQGIAKAEDMSVEDSAVDAEITKLAENQGVAEAKVRAQFADPSQLEQLRVQVLFDRVLDFVWSKAKVELVDELTTADDASEDAAGA